MSDRKNHNSLIFLTTLGVYLGLVLVGSSPAVLAQAATTRGFDIKTEIVVEDDLDNKPDDDSLVSESQVDEYFKSLVGVIKRLEQAEKDGEINSTLSPFEINFRPHGGLICAGGAIIKTSGADLSDLNVGLASWFSEIHLLSNCSKSSNGRVKHEWASTTIELIASNFTVRTAVHPFNRAQADNFAAFFRQSAAQLRAENADCLTTKLKLATDVAFENDQIFVNTTLPRASIDELLAR